MEKIKIQLFNQTNTWRN